MNEFGITIKNGKCYIQSYYYNNKQTLYYVRDIMKLIYKKVIIT